MDDALNMARHLKAFDIMGSTGQEAEKSKSRFARAGRRQGIHRFRWNEDVGRDRKTDCGSNRLNELISARSRHAAAGDHNAKMES